VRNPLPLHIEGISPIILAATNLIELRRRRAAISSKDLRINEQIKSPNVLLIDEKGVKLGVIPTSQALQIAQERNFDLVEVAASADPPVCRLLNFGKFLYERAKKEKEARKAQVKVEIKEIRLRPKIGEHDMAFKLRDARRFLERGAKVKIRIRFRGREISHPEIAQGLLTYIGDELKDVAVIEQQPAMEGLTMLMIVAPNK
jgi:translation initiation factor IF-3